MPQIDKRVAFTDFLSIGLKLFMILLESLSVFLFTFVILLFGFDGFLV